MTASTTQQYKVWQPLLLAICTVIGLLAGGKLRNGTHTANQDLQTVQYDHGRELNEIVRFIEEKYVDKVNSDALIESAVSALLKNLDPHSGYLSPAEVRDLNEKMEGRFEGIGIEFHRLLDTAIVLNVIPDGPAEKAGVQRFDRIIAVDDSSMTNADLSEADMMHYMRGAQASEVRLSIVRHGVDSLIHFKIQRDVIPINSVESAYMISPNVGYIRIASFSAHSYKEFMDQVERMTQKEQMEDLIIDVRQNPGGYLKEAVNILSQLFEEKGKLLLYTEGEHAPKTEYRSTGKPFFKISHIAVLVDEGSASASEILAGSLQDNDRAVVIGTPTYGKGLVQEQYALSNGGALRLTIARYYTPSGRLIQKPYTNGEAVADNGQSIGDTTRYHTSEGRTVRGSGGITPDILVGRDFDMQDERTSWLYDKILQFAVYGYRPKYEYSSLDDMLQRFPTAREVADDVISYYAHIPASQGTVDTAGVRALADQTRLLLMAMIASDRFGYETWYQVMNAEDPVVQKALEVIREDPKITLKLD